MTRLKQLYKFILNKWKIQGQAIQNYENMKLSHVYYVTFWKCIENSISQMGSHDKVVLVGKAGWEGKGMTH